MVKGGLTVKDLYEEMGKRMEQGQGDYVVFVTDDEEGNGYHALWYHGSTPKEMGDYERQLFEKDNCDLSLVKDDTSKAVYIG